MVCYNEVHHSSKLHFSSPVEHMEHTSDVTRHQSLQDMTVRLKTSAEQSQMELEAAQSSAADDIAAIRREFEAERERLEFESECALKAALHQVRTGAKQAICTVYIHSIYVLVEN